MSSLSTTPDQYRAPSGKTPPPAASAAYSKRAWEIQAEERMNSRYRPPALRALSSGEGTPSETSGSITSPSESVGSPSSNYPPGFRRARAGTLPSNVTLAADHLFGSAPPLQTSSSATSLVDIAANAPLTRPNLRHANSAVQSDRLNRLRSGSLTTLPSGLSSAFGPAVFASSWLASSSSRENDGMDGGFRAEYEEMRPRIQTETSLNDEYGHRTLDYLGLDESPTVRAPPPATVSELRNQAQAAIAGSLSHPSRHRAQTVSNFNRRSMAFPQGGLDYEPQLIEPQRDEYSAYRETQPITRPRVDSLEGALGPNQLLYNNSYVAKGFKPQQHLSSTAASRPRAVSVSLLEDSLRGSSTSQRHGGLGNQGGYMNEGGLQPPGFLSTPSSGSGTPTPNSILRNAPSVHGESREQKTTLTRPTIQTVGVRFPDSQLETPSRTGSLLSVPLSSGSRSVSPKATEGNNQTPSRSLWIGNLDSHITGQLLANAFAKYGPIESFRMLAEKECGFVNFVDISDAIRAKEDVLEAQGGVIPSLGNSQPVRIGFGKIDSAPSTPMGVTSPGGAPGFATPLSAVAPQSAGGMEAQLQSSPTRALWIGSIPSTTTPATILSIFSPFGPIESARVLTHKNCGFVNFERLDDAVRARKALNGRDVLGSDVGAIRIGFARVPTKGAATPTGLENVTEESGYISGPSGVGDMTIGAAIHALRNIKGATSVPTDQQILGGSVENYRSNLLLNMVSAGLNQPTDTAEGTKSGVLVTEQQMIMRELSDGVPSEPYLQAMADFRPPTMYYTTIPAVAERGNNRRWDATKLRDLRKKLDAGALVLEEVDATVTELLDGEIVELASDWLGNTVVQKLFEKCSLEPRMRMLERLAPHLATIGIHKNGTWAAQKIIECSNTPEEVALISQNLRPYCPPLLLDQFGNYVVQCCLRFGPPANDFIFDAMVDRLWEIAQGRFGARSMRACLESPHITIHQQKRLATAIILNSIPLATNPNGALLLTWLLDSSGFPARYRLLAPRFTPHLSHLCAHKLASLTVLRIINQKLEPEAAEQVLHALFYSPNDHVLNDVLSDQVNGVATIHKIVTSAFIDPNERAVYMDATKRVLIELKATGTQAYRRLVEEVGLPVTATPAPPFLSGSQSSKTQQSQGGQTRVANGSGQTTPMGYAGPADPSYISAFQAMQLQGAGSPLGYMTANGLPTSPQSRIQLDPRYQQMPAIQAVTSQMANPTFSPSTDPFNPFALRSPDLTPASPPRARRNNSGGTVSNATSPSAGVYMQQSNLPSLSQAGSGLMGLGQAQAFLPPNLPPQQVAYMLQEMQMMQNGAYQA
ncbi:hypothetical protein CALCODRAFT_499618 [Calocera cornea HHB12733]|uniref:ARM repeat-containing protein n=1 Tax=Calocera cornea HHB12733 TaxID=1353952 RepID=A0A165ECM9_9BASI|nr:hypothetical protein CALCODRAFT_499618 [Calocera cornea HHB12733]